MKTKLLIRLYAVFFIGSMSLLSANAQVVTCYDSSESSANDFWLTHFYYSKCTDYLNTGGKDISDPAWSTYVDFNGGGYIDFTKIRVSEDGTYTVRLSYGIGWAEPVVGANFNVIVNDEFTGNYVVLPQVIDPANPPTIDLPVTLSTDWDNEIKIQQNKDWPTTLGIQLIKGIVNAIPSAKENSFKISGMNKSIQITGLNNSNNNIQIYSLVGKLISSEAINGASYTKSIKQGAYIVKINDATTKVIVQ
ncbi:MAG: T9SS type A sorting domain-containing protein [Paludibacter sp.]|nr:T9SS type A sorting domain-containing protein [Paludibacter sp.]